ncbi:conjugal transfer protein TraB [Rhizobium sp. BT-226]|uniref:conjugal transfer protein TraB n=1 Tax=Rhizobium sp. BT-226 TaxID=2986922 RepID=UPI0021F6F149|nr:conjugal transfer protein TraB [Rhizobium sp. BT-226]MCW0021326.1 conjugal transfer protein TraB [Rhizobium sp. BT-226]
MRRDLARNAALIAGAVATGWIGWSGEPRLLPVSLLFPLIWSKAPSRAVTVLVAMGYFLAASRGLPLGIVNFYGSNGYEGYLLWIISASGFVSAHTICWEGRSERRRLLGFAVATVVTILPPVGIAGWANPLTAAGILFPGWGWSGLIVTGAGMLFLVTKRWPIAAVAIGGLTLWSAAGWTPPNVPAGWTGSDTQFGQALGRGFNLSLQRDLTRSVHEASARSGADMIVLPESAFGFWTPTIEQLWQQELAGSNTTVVGGAAVVTRHGYDNVVIAVKADGASIVYRQRMPVPVSMWQPWREWSGQSGGASAGFFNDPVVEIAGHRVTVLVCYEQLIAWPVLQSMLHRPDAIIAIGNGWWTKGTSIVAVQRASVFAWGRLFDIPLVLSFNT